MLQVRFAEVNRRALTRARRQLLRHAPATSPVGRRRSSSRRPTSTTRVAEAWTFSDFLNLFFFDRQRRHRARSLKALRVEGLLPEPGRAEPDRLQRPGGELPGRRRVPGPGRPGRRQGAVTVIFKEFGVRLTFTPTIAGDVIRLKVTPEVSSLDFNNGITLQGFRIPALITRRAETDVELRDGQSFAIAGLLNNLTQETARRSRS